jgi:hypothetical protein
MQSLLLSLLTHPTLTCSLFYARVLDDLNVVCRGLVAGGSGRWIGRSDCDGIERPIRHVYPEPPTECGLRLNATSTIYCISACGVCGRRYLYGTHIFSGDSATSSALPYIRLRQRDATTRPEHLYMTWSDRPRLRT